LQRFAQILSDRAANATVVHLNDVFLGVVIGISLSMFSSANSLMTAIFLAVGASVRMMRLSSVVLPNRESR
jgi:hypothetical protein